ncbi:unnamed protein product [Eruca vesicaria subsp. sativa]|uniref:PRA1 family protein n=1 Tax=Eruca vesicaria subsp. sativa TaxID=29727 RepID=A0ABC8K012_ERUVS|nr:unnamed protein product [Eruca vesicaria subsp. sativa]
MTNYGTIQTSSHASPSPVVDVESPPSDNNQCTNASCGMPRRPWGVMFDVHSMGLPHGFSDASSRFKTNYNHFRTNYGIIVCIIILIAIYGCLINHHPVWLIPFTALVILYIFLIYLMDDDAPFELFRYWMVSIIQSFLILLTMGLLFLTNVTRSFSRPLVIGYVLILIHTVVRKTDDLFLDEESATMTETFWNPLGLHVVCALFYLYLNFG